MQTNILKKCIEELCKENPKLDYIRGMLETLVEIAEVPKDASLIADEKGGLRITTAAQEVKNISKDEGSMLDAMAGAAMKNIAKIETVEGMPNFNG